jgi:glucosamine--fructose-6-phosphate aminotransferase (isomerizing)
MTTAANEDVRTKLGEEVQDCAVASRLADESTVLALTTNTQSTLARQADTVVTCAAGPETGVAATKTFVCQIIAALR